MTVRRREFSQHLTASLPGLMRFALSLCKNEQDAHDLVQSTCERALGRTQQFERGTRFESWVFSIMHSIWKNQLRRAGHERRYLAELAQTEASVDGTNVAHGKIVLSEVLSKMKELPDGQAAALTLVCIEGLSYKDAAQVLEIPQGTMESRVARGRIALGRLLEGGAQSGQVRSGTGKVTKKLQ